MKCDPPFPRSRRAGLWGAALLMLLQGCATDTTRPSRTDGEPLDVSIYEQLHYWPQQEAADDDGRSCVPASLIGLDPGVFDAEHADLWSRVRAGYALEGAVDEHRIDRQIGEYSDKQRLFDLVDTRASWYLYYVVQELEARDMPLEIALLPILESGYNPRAVSPSRAAGLWQIVPGTGTRMGLEQNGWYDGRKDVVASTEAALDYLSELHKRFDGDWYLALAAYNAGEGSVQRAIDRNRRLGKPTDYWSLPLSQQACNYVPRLIALSRVLEDPEDHGIELSPIPNQASVVPVEINRQVDLQRAANSAGMDSRDLLSLNPAFSRGFTSPRGSSTLLVPASESRSFLAAVSGMPGLTPAATVPHAERYRVRPGDTLRDVARLHETTPAALRSLNGIDGDMIIAGQYLQIPGDAVVPPHEYPTTESVELKKRGIYVVKPGDSLSLIAQRVGVSAGKIAAFSGIDVRSTLRVGQQLQVRSPTARMAGGTHEPVANGRRRIEYTVRSGDSVARIAGRFNVGVSEVIRWNAMNSNRPVIHPGQTLVLYVAQALAGAART